MYLTESLVIINLNFSRRICYANTRAFFSVDMEYIKLGNTELDVKRALDLGI